MKNYDPNIRWGSHKVKVTFQSFEKKAHVICSMGGNCKGGDILKSIIDSLVEGDESAIVDNKAGLSFNNDDWFFIKE